MLELPRDVAAGISLLVLDVDGVLTNAQLFLGHEGEEIKAFSVRDGVGIKFAQHAGIEIAFLSARSSAIVEARGRMLGVEEIHQGIHKKLATVKALARARGIGLVGVAYVGDDLVDIEAVSAVGLGVAVGDAVEELKRASAYVTTARGGFGAVRETVEAILKARGDWEDVVREYIATA